MKAAQRLNKETAFEDKSVTYLTVLFNLCHNKTQRFFFLIFRVTQAFVLEHVTKYLTKLFVKNLFYKAISQYILSL